MPVPRLPPEVWFTITTHLDANALSSFSQVNKTFNQLATDITHFRRHLTGLETGSLHPTQQYRRLRALSHPPEEFVTASKPAYVNMLCIAHDTLLLFNLSKQCIKTFPNGLSITLKSIFGKWRPASLKKVFEEWSRSYLILPGNRVGFVTNGASIQLFIINVKTGEVMRHKLPGKPIQNKSILDGRSILVAGAKAEWLLYYATEKMLVFFDWRHGTMARTLKVPENIRYVLNECPAIDGMSVTGYISTTRYALPDRVVKDCSIISFDGQHEAFLIPLDKNMEMAVRSADKETDFILISSPTPAGKEIVFLASKTCGERVKRWTSAWTTLGRPTVRENGRVFTGARSPFLRHSRVRNASGNTSGNPFSRPICILFEDNEKPRTIKATEIKDRHPPLWYRRTADGAVGLMVHTGKGNIDFVQIKHAGGEGSEREVLLKRWVLKDLVDLCVVADHFIVAKTKDAKLSVLHFDRFCRGAGGVYACPLLEPKAAETNADGRPHKKRRISEEHLVEAR